VTGPSEEVHIPGWYVEDLVGNMPKECSNLAGSDQSVEPRGGVAINCRRVVMRHGEAFCSPHGVQDCLCGAHPAGIRTMVVREHLAVVIVFLLVDTEHCKGNGVIP